MSIHNVALMRAINILTATKCQFKIIAPDGTQYGDLQVSQKTKMKRRSPGLLRDHFNVTNMQVGDVKTFKPDGVVITDMDELKKVLSKYLYRVFGKDSTIVHQLGDTLEVMRVL